MKLIHKIQQNILHKLLFSSGLRYSELKPSKRMENNQFDFHLDQLIKLGYIEHIKTLYRLTAKGKDFTNRIDTDDKTQQFQSKLGVVVIPHRTLKGKDQYLIYTRLKHPFYGCQGFMSGKVRYGEKIVDTAKRELFEETKLEGTPFLVGIRHYLVFDEQSGELVEDKILFFCGVESPTGNLHANNEGKFSWIGEEDFKKSVINHFESFDVFLEDVDLFRKFDGHVKVVERQQYTDKY